MQNKCCTLVLVTAGTTTWSSCGALWELRLALVTNVSVVASLPVSCVTHHLGATIGKLHTIFASYHITIACGLVCIVVGRFGVLNSVFKVEWHSGNVNVILLKKHEGAINTFLNFRGRVSTYVSRLAGRRRACWWTWSLWFTRLSRLTRLL